MGGSLPYSLFATRHSRYPPSMASDTDISTLLDIMRRLRDPRSGCPWDIEQTFASIVPYTIEEAYEVAGAIEDGDWPELKDELGDLLLQVVFHARMAEEQEMFAFGDVVAAIVDKMTRRHPHVFGGAAGIGSSEAQTVAWEEHKARERAERPGGLLDDVPRALPALLRAVKLQRRASTVGFDWDSAPKVVEKIAQFILQPGQVFVLDGAGDLIGFLDRVRRDGGESLLDIPRAAGLRIAQPAHDVEQGGDVGVRSHAAVIARMASGE